MGAADNDLIDAAVFAAEEKVSAALDSDTSSEESKEPTSTEEPSAGEPAAEAPETSEQQPEVETKSQDQEAKPEELEAQPDAGASEDAEPIEFPEFWSAKLKKAAAKAPKELLKEFVEYDAQRTQWAYGVANESERLKASDKSLNEAVEPIKAQMLEYGLNPVSLTKRAAEWIQLETINPLQAAKAYVQRMGFTPQDLLQDDGSPPPELQQQEDLRAEIAKLREDWQNQQTSLAQQRLQAEIDSFRNEKDASGNLLRPHLGILEPKMAEVIKEIKAQHPKLSNYEYMNHAYNFLAQQLGIAGNKTQQSKPAPEQLAAQAKKAKSAAASVTGGPAVSVASRPKTKSVDEAIDRAFNAVGMD